jgi:low affinity Fe/Cu permease
LKNLYRHTENLFERLTSLATAILGNSITFILALGIVIYWCTDRHFFSQGLHEKIENIILGTSFLTLFIIQKAFNRFSGSLHLKVNELVASHEPANNAVLSSEDKTESEIFELAKEYTELGELAILEKLKTDTDPTLTNETDESLKKENSSPTS